MLKYLLCMCMYKYLNQDWLNKYEEKPKINFKEVSKIFLMIFY